MTEKLVNLRKRQGSEFEPVELLKLLSKVENWTYDSYSDGFRGNFKGFIVKFDEHFNNRHIYMPASMVEPTAPFFYIKIETEKGHQVESTQIYKGHKESPQFDKLFGELRARQIDGKIPKGEGGEKLRTVLRKLLRNPKNP